MNLSGRLRCSRSHRDSVERLEVETVWRYRVTIPVGGFGVSMETFSDAFVSLSGAFTVRETMRDPANRTLRAIVDCAGPLVLRDGVSCERIGRGRKVPA